MASDEVTATRAGGVRARARAEMTSEIKRIARDHLAVDGPNLSLRAVARDLGVVSSAVYRYFDSRDALLTALIVDGYGSLADAVDAGQAGIAKRDLVGRWMAIGRSVRGWALARPHEYALLYGSPVPGYAAPSDTVTPANRPVLVFVGVLRDAVERGPVGTDRLAKAVRADLEAVVSDPAFGGLPPGVLARGMTAWTQLFGAVSFELFGRLTNAIHDYDAWFDHQLKSMAAFLELP